MWQCPRQAYLPFTCPEFQNHRDRPEWLLDLAVSSVGNSPALEVLVCKPGYQLAQDGSTCEWCQPGFFCDGSNANGNGAQQCPRGRMSGPMSQSEGDCYKCTPNYYCDANSAGQETPCPPNTISPPASESLQDCTCMEGYYNKLPLEQGCTICPAGYICPGGAAAPVQCAPPTTDSPPGSYLDTQCTCPPGKKLFPAYSLCCDINGRVVNGQCRCRAWYEYDENGVCVESW